MLESRCHDGVRRNPFRASNKEPHKRAHQLFLPRNGHSVRLSNYRLCLGPSQ